MTRLRVTGGMHGDWSAPISAVANGAIILDAQGLERLYETSLQVARSGSLHSGVHQALPPRHAVEVVLLLTSQPLIGIFALACSSSIPNHMLLEMRPAAMAVVSVTGTAHAEPRSMW